MIATLKFSYTKLVIHFTYFIECAASKLMCLYCSTCFKNDVLVDDILKHTCFNASLSSEMLCVICGLTFKFKWLLKRHLYKHTGEKIHACYYCNYCSVYSCDVKKHMRNHTGERPYKCEYCIYSGKTSWNLKLHVGRRHDVKKK